MWETRGLEDSIGETSVKDGEYLDATYQVDIIAHLATNILDVLSQIDTLVGND